MPDDLVQKRINNELAIGILTTGSYHKRLAEALSSWWDVEKYPSLVTIWTDSLQQPAEVHVPGLYNTECEDSYHYGLWCKNGVMLKQWMTDPKYAKVKWFLRIMDDTYLHLENLMHLLDQYDHREPIVLADKFCSELGYQYPSGGPGIIISRGLLEKWDWNAWNRPETEHKDKNSYYDDVLWGQYLHLVNVPITHHHGLTQHSFGSQSTLFLFYETFFRGTDRKWPLPFRPVGLHQHRTDIPMATIHKRLHAISYEPVDENLIPVPDCECQNDHRHCFWDKHLSDSSCKYESDQLKCFFKSIAEWV